jgi:hypothetical protein
MPVDRRLDREQTEQGQQGPQGGKEKANRYTNVKAHGCDALKLEEDDVQYQGKRQDDDAHRYRAGVPCAAAVALLFCEGKDQSLQRVIRARPGSQTDDNRN